MSKFLLTVYRISTMITTIEADSREEAERLASDPNGNFDWLVIPTTAFSFFASPVEEEEEDDS